MKIEVLSGHNIFKSGKGNEVETCKTIIEITLRGINIDEEACHPFISPLIT